MYIFDVIEAPFSLVIVACIMPLTSRLSLAPHDRKLDSAGIILPILLSYNEGGIIVNSLPVSVNNFTLLSPILTHTFLVLFLQFGYFGIGDIFFRTRGFEVDDDGWEMRFIDVSVM